jgi:hypothetical protein
VSQFNVLLSFCPTPQQISPKKATEGCLNPLQYHLVGVVVVVVCLASGWGWLLCAVW